MKSFTTGLALGLMLGVIGFLRIELWQWMATSQVHVGPVHLGYDYGEFHTAIAIAVGLSVSGVVLFGALTGSMLPFVLRRFGFDPASASAPFVATLVDVTGVVIYFAFALLFLSGKLL